MKINFKKKDLYTIPNILCYIRLILIPIVVVLYINAEEVNDYYLATLLLAICAMTDLVDGYVARHFHQITDLGKIIDPIADKLMQVSILFCLVVRIKGMLPVLILFIVKELFMGIAGLFLLKSGRKLTGAKWFGKICTVVLDVSIAILFAFPRLDSSVINGLLTLSVAFMIFSFVMYIADYIKIFCKKERYAE